MKNSAHLVGLRNLLRSSIRLITVHKNRYLDIGDWNKQVVTSVYHSDPRSEAGVLVHELVEYILCTYFGISAFIVDEEDEKILAGVLKKKDASYYPYHKIAEKIEREVVKAMGLSWKEHDKNCIEAFKIQEQLFVRKSK